MLLQHLYIAFFTIIVSLSLSPTLSESVEYYVTPTSLPNSDCPQPCYTLEYYGMNPSLLSNKKNVSLLFLEGLHILNNTLMIEGTKQLELTQAYSGTEVAVECNSDVWFKYITHLKISNLTLYGHAELRYNTHIAHVQHLTVEGFKLVLVGNSSINHCHFNSSTVSICAGYPITNTRERLMFFKSKLINSKILAKSLCKDLQVTISRCVITRGKLDSKGTITFSIGPAENLNVEIMYTWIDVQLESKVDQGNNNISFYFHHCEIRNTWSIKNFDNKPKNNSIFVHISDCKIYSETDYNGGLNLDVAFATMSDILLVNTSISNHSNDGAVQVHNNEILVQRPLRYKIVMRITIKNCTFTSNRRAMLITIGLNIKVQLAIVIIDSLFYGNENAIDFRKGPLQLQRIQKVLSHFSITSRNATFENNSPYRFESGVIRLVDVDMLILEDCRIINNQGTGIESYNSGITLTGDNLFSNNTSTKGGALLLYESYLYINVSSNTSFLNNFVQDVGGAIFVRERPYFQSNRERPPPCFFDYLYRPDFNIYFKGNLALSGGDDIYGGSLRYSVCTKSHNLVFIHIEKIFHFQGENFSSVTSDPTRVCLCDDQGAPQCASMKYIYRELPSRYPGEVFTVPAVVVGYDFGSVPGIVHSELVEEEGGASNRLSQSIQEIKNHRECTLLNFSIETPHVDRSHRIRLTISQSVESKFPSEEPLQQLLSAISYYEVLKMTGDFLLKSPVYINITLENCPTGFALTTTFPHICTCHPTLEDNGIRVCVITNHTGLVYRSGTVWVSDTFSENDTNSFVVHQYCPYDYCKPENISVDLKLPDTQCAFNHSGVLCGGCYGNLSLAHGTSKCLPCDNKYVSLFVAFISAGFALVLFIKTLDLTVAKGTINGLIFYANIIWANKNNFFPTRETIHPGLRFLQIFIAWINLDLGIETCFIEGLDAYWKTWLQFVFPLYVWTITGVVIIASHYSIRASKIFGNNSVPVLATLILLSYAKLLRTIITSLGFSLLNYPEFEGTRVVWSFDGNVLYFGVAHTILFLVALAALLLLWLPYTTVLLTLQWLRRKSYIKPLRWINRWKPFFDAYFGQLKPKHHYWFGLLLLVRVFLLVLFAATSAVVPKLNIVAMTITGHLLMIQQVYSGSMYKSLHLSILENSFIVNLTVLGIAKLYLPSNDPAHTSVVYTSIGVVFIQFLAIVIYHTWSRLKSTYLTYKRRYEGENMASNRELRVVAAVPHHQIHYREPLLDSSVQNE